MWSVAVQCGSTLDQMIQSNVTPPYKRSSKNEIKRPGECAFSRGNWCDYEQDPDDDLDWSISSDGYAIILLNQHQKLQYGRLLSPFIRSKVSATNHFWSFL